MADAEFAINDLVWAKMKGFSPWPGRVAKPPPELMGRTPKKNSPVQLCILFFGTNNYAWIELSAIKPFHSWRDKFETSCKTATFKDAIKQIDAYIQDPSKFAQDAASPDPDEEFDKLRENDSSAQEVITTTTTASFATPKKVTPLRKPKTDPKTAGSAKSNAAAGSLKRPASTSGDDSATETPTSVAVSAPKRKKRVSSSSTAAAAASSTLNHNSGSGSSSINNESYAMNAASPDYTVPTSTRRTNLLNRPVAGPPPELPPIDMNTISVTLSAKEISASPLRFGFLGLGVMGSGIVKNLINSGHKVMVWSRTASKCDAFAAAGAQVGKTPSDVVDETDITFSCVSDPQAAKDMVFGNCGVLKAAKLCDGKGYVEMTSIDHETSTDIAEAICSKGGRYLEAQIQGTRAQAGEGTLIMLAAGDRGLFDECQTCFEAVGRNSYFLGDVGNATKMNLVLQMIAGVSLVGLAESMAVAVRSGLKLKDVLEVLELTNMASPLIIDKGNEMLKGEYAPNLALKHMQKDLRLALALSETLGQPLSLTATANEVFKHAKRLGYADHDASAVYVRTKF